MKKLIPVILCCAMLLAACGSSADSAPAASESTSAAASSEAASSAESIIGGADGETDIVVSDEANTANLDAAVAAIEAVNPIANPRALDDFSVENELMLTMDNLVGYKGDVTNDQADCGLVFVAQAKDGKGMENLEAHERVIAGELLKMGQIDGVRILGPQTNEQRIGTVAFEIDGVHPHDVGQFIDAQGIAIRVGHHCAQPVHRHFGVYASNRASSGIYNSVEDAQALVEALKKVRPFFGVE